jgi:hypothetical protein
MFDFITISSNVHHFSLNNVNLEQVSSLEQIYEITKFDFFVRFVYNPTAAKNKLSCSLGCSRDLFEEKTVIQMGQRFQHFFEQIFSTKSSAIEMNESVRSINKLSLILAEETEELQRVAFHRLPNIDNSGMYVRVAFS